MKCNRCGIKAEDLPSGVWIGEFFERLYDEMYCIGCFIAYEEGIWLLSEEEIGISDVK